MDLTRLKNHLLQKRRLKTTRKYFLHTTKSEILQITYYLFDVMQRLQKTSLDHVRSSRETLPQANTCAGFSEARIKTFPIVNLCPPVTKINENISNIYMSYKTKLSTKFCKRDQIIVGYISYLKEHSEFRICMKVIVSRRKLTKTN